MIRIALRKSLFGSLPQQAPKLHEPMAERTAADGTKLTLVRSTTDPRVRRWRKATSQGRVFHGPEARSVLNEAFDNRGTVYLTRARLEHPEVRALVSQGLLELHQEPRHHAHEFRGTLTKAGKEAVRLHRENHQRLTREAQVGMFKGRPFRFVFDLRKAEQIGLFGAKPAEHTASATQKVPGVVQVRAHVTHDAHGSHMVAQHERHVQLAAKPIKATKKPAAEDLASKRPSDARFEGITVEGYFRAGSPAGMEWMHHGDPADISCVRCGAKIGHVFATNHGMMGGDCLATLTGDDSTRRIARVINQKLLQAAPTPSLHGFQVSTSTSSGATIRGLYSREGRNWDYLLWASDSVPAALVHGIVQQFTESYQDKALTFRAAIDAAHVTAQKVRKETQAAAVDERVEQIKGRAMVLARAYALADHYRGDLQAIAETIPGNWRVGPGHTDPKSGAKPAMLLIKEWGTDTGAGPDLIRAATAAGFKFERDTRDGLRFVVPSVEAIEGPRRDKEAPPGAPDLTDFDPMAFFAEIDAGGGGDQVYEGRLRAAKEAIEARAAGSADSIARKIAVEELGSARALRKGIPMRFVILRKAQMGMGFAQPKAPPKPPAAPKTPGGKGSPETRGLKLVASKENPQVKRWQAGDVKPATDHVKFNHPDTGEPSTGQVVSGGASGITVADHKTGKTAKLKHGHYVATDPPNANAEPAKPTPKPKVAPKEGPNLREQFPGLNKYPPPGVTPDIGKEGDDWKLRWRSPTTQKMVQAYETSYLRENMREKFRRINGVGAHLTGLRATLDDHMALHPSSQAAVKAAMVRTVDHTAMRAGNETSMAQGVHGISTLLKSHARVDGDKVHLSYVGKSSVPQEHTVDDPKVAAVVKHLLTLPGDRLFQASDHRGELAPVKADDLNDYVRAHLGEDHTLKDIRTFHATRLFSEAADRIGAPAKGEDPDEKVRAAALEVAKLLGHKKAMTRGHFAVHEEGQAADGKLVEKHGGKLYMHGKRRAVGFHTAGARKAYQKEHGDGASTLEKGEHPEVSAEWKHEEQTSLDNYIDPTVVEAYRRGLTLSGSLAKAAGGSAGMSADERRFVAYLGKVTAMDPYKYRGGQP